MYKRFFVIIIFLLLLVVNGGMGVAAMNTGFSTEPLSPDDTDTFLKNANISVLEEAPEKEAIKCFDVNEEGVLAVSSTNSETKTVCLYNSNGEFLNGYQFQSSGKIGIELDGDTLLIYFVRSNVAIAVSPTGEIEDIAKIQNTIENNSYWNHSVFTAKRQVGDVQYQMQNDLGLFNSLATSYSRVVATRPNGEEIIIYDASEAQKSDMIITGVSILTLFCIILIVVIWRFKEEKADDRSQGTHRASSRVQQFVDKLVKK